MSNHPDKIRKNTWIRLLIGLLLVFCISLVSTGFILKRGIQVKSLQIGRTVISGVSLRWQDKLNLEINSISTGSGPTGEFSKDFDLVDKIVRASFWGEKLFSRIILREIEIGDMTASVHLDRQLSYVTLRSEDLNVRADLDIDGDAFLINVTKAVSNRFNSQLSGQIRINGKNKEADGSISANLGGVLPVALDFTADPEWVSFHGQESGQITNIKPFVDLFGLDQSIQRWITDYLTGSRYNLKTFSGSFPWADPMVLLQSFYAEARVDDCDYTFATGLEAIKTEYADVVFSKGVLAITPHNSTFYGQDGGKSWLDINFNDPDNIILTAHILTSAVANKDILNLLSYYDISLPFRQTKGKTAIDLTLAINLNSEEVTAWGTFVIDEGAIEYEQKYYDVKNGRIALEDSMITIEKLHISFEKMFSADISGKFDAEKSIGDLEILLQKFAVKIKDSYLILDESKAKPTLRFQIQPDKTTVSVSDSFWKLGVLSLKLGAFNTPFSFKDISGILPPTSLSLPPGVKSKISGTFSLKEQSLDLNCDLLQYNVQDLILGKNNCPLTVQFDKELTIRSKTISQWSLNQIPVSLYPSELNYSNNILSVVSGRMSYGKFFDSNISGQFDQLTKQGTFTLKNLQIKDDFFGLLLSPDDTMTVRIDAREENLVITVPELDLVIITGENKNWSVKFADLAAIHKYSPFMQKYMLDAGQLEVMSEQGGEAYRFSADIPFHYHFLVKDSSVMDQYHIQGTVTGEGASATINDAIQILYGKELLMTSWDISYNIPAIIQFLKDLPTPDAAEEKKTGITCKLKAYNSSFYFTEDRRALADQIDLTYDNNKINIQLEHGPGSITIDIEGKNFSLAGDSLNDVFMDSLIPKSDFNTGKMSMAAKGSFDEFSALFKIEDTIIRDFLTLNNVLALVNTIPALITFSLPSYNTTGLPVDSMVAGMKVKDGLATFDSLSLESPEISILGDGWIDFSQERIEMDLNLITRAKKNINKIPLVGYILSGKEKRPSITVTVSGDLFEPEVKHSIFKEVATQPFSMVYRTLALPGRLVSHMFKGNGDKQKVDSNSNGEQLPERLPDEEYSD
ncbi:MAG TPA: hypothetical protein EYP35_03070 [Desulfobacterales bacterium]|nr:hypothetical protein [Desulfobacterales bacterium]HIP38276.1 hypothetical protein [Desulfocapsa sulfexigens]